jgi:hypothetical protein
MTKNNEVYNVTHNFEAITSPAFYSKEYEAAKVAYESTKAKYETNQKTRTIAKTDSIVDSVIDKFVSRAKFGKNKYGTDLDRQDLSVVEWLDHAIEEHMDAILYLNKLKEIIVGKDGKIQKPNQ